jgi:hypothetical protein
VCGKGGRDVVVAVEHVLVTAQDVTKIHWGKSVSYSFEVMPLPGPPLLNESPPPSSVDRTARGTRSLEAWPAP